MSKTFVADVRLILEGNIEKLQKKARIGDILLSGEYRYVRVDARKNKGTAWILEEVDQ